MSLNKKSVDDINVKGLRVLCRCDFNVPLKDGKITDENRLVAALPTIMKLIADGGKVILCSHLGKVKTEEDKKTKTLAPVAVRLSELLGQEVKFVADPEVVGPNARAAVEAMKDGEVILLENTRFRPEETKNGEAFSKDLASICDVFVNDAFGTAHRAHCSNVGVAQLVDTAVVGYLMQKNIAQKETLELQVIGENPVVAFNAVIMKMCNLSSINIVENKADGAASFMVGTTEYAVPLGNMIDVEAEIARMEAELKHKEGFLQGVLKKLGNEKFVNNAPAAVLEMERKKRQMLKVSSNLSRKVLQH